MSKKVALVALGMLIMAAAGVIAGTRFLKKEKIYPAFTLQSHVTNILEDGSHIVDKTTTYGFSDGSWRTSLTDKEGSGTEYFFKAGKGFFVVNHKNKVLKQNTPASQVASPSPAPTLTAEELRSSPQFVNTENILGLTAYLIRIKDEQTGLPLSDAYYAIELGNVPLKAVEYNYGKPTLINEPVSVTFKEPDASLLKLPDYAIAP